ncbi:bacterioferritin [Candidatus Tenderia electrophaga]|jgi:bacterioferritin|uniref:Bacterioferritin n=1 Tax=Candidatus Tenderia electrophaga TaxID=1748243 RepID=A0A0S2TEW8_9GAMM|nr:bacterioferritin [Candidatus Tenderia electrophaga]
MKGNKPIIKLLNRVLKNELTSTSQFFLHARIYKNWGFNELNETSYKASIKAMKQADDLINRVLFLEGLPNLQDLGKLRIGEDPKEMIEADLALTTEIRSQLVEGIAQCESAPDYVSRELLEEMLEHTEEYLDWLETQLSLIDDIGIQNYLQKMM